MKDALALHPDYPLIATYVSVVEEKAGAGLYIQHLGVQRTVRPPEFTPIYDAELPEMILPVKQIPPSFTKTFMISDTLSVVQSFDAGFGARYYITFLALLPKSINNAWPSEERMLTEDHRG